MFSNSMRHAFISLVSILIALPSFASPSCDKTDYACATANNVKIYDSETLRVVGKLARGECMEVKCVYTIKIMKNGKLYYRVIGGLSRQERLVPARFTVVK
jgi:hypothetical protein